MPTCDALKNCSTTILERSSASELSLKLPVFYFNLETALSNGSDENWRAVDYVDKDDIVDLVKIQTLVFAGSMQHPIERGEGKALELRLTAPLQPMA
jgi:hypothetical protein